MKKRIRAMVAATGVAAVVGVSGVAQAADTTLKYEVSTDGLNWSNSLNALPGTQIQVRARVIWSGSTPVYGLNQLFFQPVVSNWTLADHLETTAGTPVNPNNSINPSGTGPGGVGILGGAGTNPSGNVPDLPGVWGRVSPFAWVATGTSNYLRGFLGTGTAAGLLRIAQASASNWIGVGPTSGMNIANNWSGGGGVPVAQVAPGFTNRPGNVPYLPGIDVVVFKFGFTLSNAGDARTLSIDTPQNGFQRQSAVGVNYGKFEALWNLSPTDTVSTNFYNSIGTEPAFVSLVPTPGACALGLLVTAVSLRRRR